MFPLLQPFACRTLASATRGLSSSAARRALHSQAVRSGPSRLKHILWGSVAAVSGILALQSAIQLDADPVQADETIDPASSIAFPNTLRIQSKQPLPTFSLVGLGVRTVSFLGIKVYSVGFYADLSNPNLNVPKSASPEEKIEHIVRNTACVLRIVPTRSTSFSHLRDGFLRALQARLVLFKQRGQLTPDDELAIQAPLRKLKSMFPNTPLAKHQSLDILLAPPVPGQPRNLIVRDLGAVQDDWLAEQFILGYFEGSGLSPPLKKSVFERLQNFGN
ncbi:hypothetical protein PHLGIDRAFT_33388 [Phlebiopsis gigantea 11061_1 CR5-6]|uniref:Chalcone isomerase domain-containing protein n=1 Tax=Phlebiopsis gigantea (strain 11061_1 CR5-6) TaxID=745531 RepID=A0A0C3S5T7_PHLG1|nr:hypothetical protein PHLGIDRAFT_33388 [Phlebiopsis gigantea 11061_1 CR5-6]